MVAKRNCRIAARAQGRPRGVRREALTHTKTLGRGYAELSVRTGTKGEACWPEIDASCECSGHEVELAIGASRRRCHGPLIAPQAVGSAQFRAPAPSLDADPAAHTDVNGWQGSIAAGCVNAQKVLNSARPAFGHGIRRRRRRRGRGWRRHRLRRRRMGSHGVWIDHQCNDKSRCIGQILAGSGLQRPPAWPAGQFGVHSQSPGRPMFHHRPCRDVATLGNADLATQKACNLAAHLAA